MLKNKFIYLLLSSLLLIFNSCNLNVSNSKQNQTDSSIVFRKLEIQHQKIYLAKVDLQNSQLEIIQNLDYSKTKNLQEAHQSNNSLLTFNGSFFSENFTPTGLLISENRELYPLVKADLLDGVFTIDQQNHPKLYQYSDFKKNQPSLKINFAIQNGPILINNNGEIVISNKSTKKANRTAIGITKDNQLVVIIDRQPILNNDTSPTLYEFANLIKDSTELKDLGIHSVLNLDGGPSTGLAINDQYFPELSKLQNIIIIKPHRA